MSETGEQMPQVLYGETQRALQNEFDTTSIAEVHMATIIQGELAEDQIEFISSRDFFFLSTVDPDGWPTVSYKGGAPGFVQVLDDRTLRFPLLDGNGMFLSSGNIDSTARIGMLFIDFETPNRLRVHATAKLNRDPDVVAGIPGAQLVVDATVENVFVNCARYIHKHTRVEDSPYIPDADGRQPTPAWKRVDLLQPFLPERDRAGVADAGGEITFEEYLRKLADGTS